MCLLLFRQFHSLLPAEYGRHSPQIPKADQRHHLRRTLSHYQVHFAVYLSEVFTLSGVFSLPNIISMPGCGSFTFSPDNL